MTSNNKSLEECTNDNTENFNFNNKQIRAKCVRVYDGDTITAVFKLEDEFYKFSIRMDRYDSPELRTKDELEKKYAILSRDYLKTLVLDKIILLVCKDYDKYGRILADVIVDEKNVNDLMLTNGYCRPYDGGTKQTWDFSKFESEDSHRSTS